MTESKKKRNLIGVIVALIVLIGLPLGSIFYVNEGVKFRKELLKEITIKGELRDFPYTAIDKKARKLYDSKEMRIAVIAKLDNKTIDRLSDYSEFKESYVSRLYEQFARRNDILFLFNENDGLKKNLVKLTGESTMNLADVGFYNASNEPTLDTLSEGRILLADINMDIRNIYVYGNERHMGKLVEHIAITIPAVEKKRYKSSKDADN